MPRPDQSIFLAHFTKNGPDFDANTQRQNPTIRQMSASQRLVGILEQRKIIASTMPWTNKKAVCFTECPWGSLLRHAEKYSSYGIGFTKKLIYSRNGNPVIYANPQMFHSQDWSESLKPFLTPFAPTYAPASVLAQAPFNGKPIDYSHEREWRVAKDFPFQYSYVMFVILAKSTDINLIPNNIVQEIGEEKFLFMDTYRAIESLWPTHIMD
jgi:hypothetical protein